MSNRRLICALMALVSDIVCTAGKASTYISPDATQPTGYPDSARGLPRPTPDLTFLIQNLGQNEPDAVCPWKAASAPEEPHAPRLSTRHVKRFVRALPFLKGGHGYKGELIVDEAGKVTGFSIDWTAKNGQRKSFEISVSKEDGESPQCAPQCSDNSLVGYIRSDTEAARQGDLVIRVVVDIDKRKISVYAERNIGDGFGELNREISLPTRTAKRLDRAFHNVEHMHPKASH